MSPRQTTAVSLSKRLFLLALLGTASVFLSKGIYSLGSAQSQDSSSQERQFKTKEFKDLPLKVERVTNLQSQKWNEDLKIEVKNVSRKPIYFIVAYILFPEAKTSAGEVGIRLMFGKRENIRIGRIADEKDMHLDPDETYVFSITEPFRRGFEGRTYKEFQLVFTLINFGDGTGFSAGTLIDYKDKKNSIRETPTGKKKEIEWFGGISLQTVHDKITRY